MAFLEHRDKILRMDRLIRLQATGNPQEFASKLEISERTLYRYINDFKNIGCPIGFCHQKQSYLYLEKGKIIIEFRND